MDMITLLGAENVSTAGWNMLEAGRQMSNVSTNLQCVLEAHQRFMDDWLLRFEQALEADREARKP